LWESGNPAVWAGFPSEVGKSEGLFHGASFPQSSPARFALLLATEAIPARCSDLQREVRIECSSSDPDVRRPWPNLPPAFLSSASPRSGASSLRLPRCYRDSLFVVAAPKTEHLGPSFGTVKTRFPPAKPVPGIAH